MFDDDFGDMIGEISAVLCGIYFGLYFGLMFKGAAEYNIYPLEYMESSWEELIMKIIDIEDDKKEIKKCIDDIIFEIENKENNK